MNKTPTIEYQTTLWEIDGFFKSTKRDEALRDQEGLSCHTPIAEKMVPDDLLFEQESLLDFSILNASSPCLN